MTGAVPGDAAAIAAGWSGTAVAPVGEYRDNWPRAQAAQPLREALSRSAQPQLFDRHDWFAGLLDECLPHARPALLSARCPASGASGWMALAGDGIAGRQSLANWYSFHWRPCFAGAHGETDRLALLRAMLEALPLRIARLSFAPLPDEDASASLLERALAACGWSTRRTEADLNHILAVRGRSFDAYWADRPGQLRSTVRRKGKRGEVALRIETAFSEAAWADYERVYALSWKPAEGSPAFLARLARAEGAAGCLRLGLAYREGQPVAAQFWTVENGIALIHKLAHDERAAAASPGTLLTAALFQHVIDRDRVDLVDFGTGDDPYKRDWMEAVRPRWRIEAVRPAHPLAWPTLARRAARSLLVGRFARS